MSEWYGAFIHQVNLWQRQFNMEISSAFRQLDEQGLSGVALILGIAFIYGVVHAIGPGHGKAVVGSYFLSQGKKVKSALKMGYMVALIHAFSALILTFGIYYLIDGVFTKTFNQTVETMYSISGGMILLIGIYLFYELYKEWNVQESTPLQPDKKSYVIALSIGIVPCPGVMTILLFSLMLGHLAVGVAAAVFMSIGMGLTISLAGMAAVQGSRASGRLHPYFVRGLQILSPLLVMALGVFLLL